MIAASDRLCLTFMYDTPAITHEKYMKVLAHATTIFEKDGPTLTEFIDNYLFLWKDGDGNFVLGDDVEIKLVDPDEVEFIDSVWKNN